MSSPFNLDLSELRFEYKESDDEHDSDVDSDDDSEERDETSWLQASCTPTISRSSIDKDAF